MYNFQVPKPSREKLPTMYELPSEDPEESGLPDTFHPVQSQLLRDTFKLSAVPADQIFIGTDVNLYYDSCHSLWYKRPDWFVCLGVVESSLQEEMRLSYVMWQENIPPFLVVELLSPGTESEDLGQTLRVVGKPPTKWEVYERILKVPYYVVFDRYVNQLRLFKLVGVCYEEVTLVEEKFWFEEIQLGLGAWDGVYQGKQGRWLRWYDAQERWIPTPEERSQRLEMQLRALGVEPE